MNNETYNSNTIDKAIQALDNLKPVTFNIKVTLKKLWPSIKASSDKGNSAKVISSALNKVGIKCNDGQIQTLLDEHKAKKKNIKINSIDKNNAEDSGENNQRKN